MLITTTSSVDGRPVQEYLGVINAQSIIGANIFKDIFAGLRDVFGGRSKTYEKVLEQAKEDALRTKLLAGQMSYDLHGLRDVVEGTKK